MNDFYIPFEGYAENMQNASKQNPYQGVHWCVPKPEFAEKPYPRAWEILKHHTESERETAAAAEYKENPKCKKACKQEPIFHKENLTY